MDACLHAERGKYEKHESIEFSIKSLKYEKYKTIYIYIYIYLKNENFRKHMLIDMFLDIGNVIFKFF